jgi:hypothetical protein
VLHQETHQTILLAAAPSHLALTVRFLLPVPVPRNTYMTYNVLFLRMQSS